MAHIYAVAGMAGVNHDYRPAHDYGVDGQFDPVIIRGNRRVVSGHPLRPRSPHLNGEVERARRTMLEEFWVVTNTKAADLDDQLALWVHHYNWHRSHEALHGLTPVERVCTLADKTPLWEAVSIAYEPQNERIRVHDYAVEMALQALK